MGFMTPLFSRSSGGKLKYLKAEKGAKRVHYWGLAKDAKDAKALLAPICRDHGKGFIIVKSQSVTG